MQNSLHSDTKIQISQIEPLPHLEGTRCQKITFEGHKGPAEVDSCMFAMATVPVLQPGTGMQKLSKKIEAKTVLSEIVPRMSDSAFRRLGLGCL